MKPSEGIEPQAASLSQRRKAGTLALVYQELFTVVVRLRSNRQGVGNAESFKANLKLQLKKAEQGAVLKGYTPEDARLASFALVAFLDESILNSGNQVFADWSRQPLQDDIFKMGHTAGEVFFQYLDQLLPRRDSEDLADLLEVYYLCLLLGYKGRYSISEPAALHGIKEMVGEKIRQIRGPSSLLSPAAAAHVDAAPPRRADPWIRKLFWASVASLLLALVLFVVFKLLLNADVSNLA
ncbi:MAG TPA: type IVB secretion system protein IcmH/DotU [Terriglobia bacterium]|nr:type IVB secretion system protein IcmH/DotU [Terriglobia bacterium]